MALPVPEGVAVTVDGGHVAVRGPRGQLEKSFPERHVAVVWDGHSLSFRAANASRQARAMVGTARSLVAGMLQGVTAGFSKELEITGVGFKAIVKGRTVDLSLGTSHPIVYPLPDGIRLDVADGTKLRVEGIDKQVVGQVAADIFSFYPVEPYKGKGVRILGRFVRRKEGKKTA
jgi:large subunit ribosomal protein L6